MGDTKNQNEADDLDRELFTLSARLERFATAVRDPVIDDASLIVFRLRGRVQKHMSRDDLAKLHKHPATSPTP